MNKNNNGDVTLLHNQQLFKQRFNRGVDLYTADLGFDVSDDYNNQESIHAKANLGQILTGLLTLKDGGSLITKQYTFFEPFTISLIGCLTFVFKELRIIKPMFSKYGNSEIYLYGSGYRYDNDVITQLFNYLEHFENKNMIPLITKSCMGKSFTKSIVNTAHDIYAYQIMTINKIIEEYTIFKNKKTSGVEIKKNNYFTYSHKIFLKQWIETHNMIRLNKSQQLKVKNVLHCFNQSKKIK
jgi:cap2 methyltransferase